MWINIYFSNSSAVPYPAFFFFFLVRGEGCHFLISIVSKKTVVQLRSLRGTVSPLLSGPFWLFYILHSSKHCSCSSAMVNLSIFRQINFYTFDSLAPWVWDLKPVYRLKNRSGYNTGQSCHYSVWHRNFS